MSELETRIARNGSNGSVDDANHLRTVVAARGEPIFQPIGGPVSVAWREGTLTRAYELQALCDWMMAEGLTRQRLGSGGGGQVSPCGGQGRGVRARSWIRTSGSGSSAMGR